MTFGVLGPLVADDGDGPIALPGPRHRAVLARLLIARRRVVPIRTLVDDLWDDPPDGAVGAIQTFVAALRRVLEPERRPRAAASLLVTEASGYALRAGPDDVDAWRFESAIGDPARLNGALALWRGPAYTEFADEGWARAEIARLEELRLLAVERKAEAALALGRAGDAVADLRAHVAEHPWRENGWELLALGLYRMGRQADALDAVRTARTALVAEFGVDPGPALRRLEADILAQAPRLDVPPAPVRAGTATAPPGLVGRAAELAALTGAATSALERQSLRVAFVSGDAGAGKTALAEALASSLATAGWTVAWGRSPEDDGAPSAWHWTQILDTLAAAGHEAVPATSKTAGDDPAAARFRARRAVVSYLAAVAARGPLLLVLDDLHRADELTFALLATLISEWPARPLLVLGTFRTTETSPALTDPLGRAARAEPARIYLGGLAEPAVAELVRATTDREVTDAAVRAIHDRSGGNPFYARELARLFDAQGDRGLSAVPAGVRDVIRHRLAVLPPAGRTVLQQAAVVGRDVDLELLIPLAGDEELVLDTVDAALQAGFLAESGADRSRFAHALVRDTLYEDLSRTRRARWHAEVARALERLRPDDVESLAQHYLRADSRATAARAAHYAAAAADRAERRFAVRTAARLRQAALTAHDRAGADTGDARIRLDVLVGLARALAFSGDLESARARRADAIAEAERLGDPELTARVIGAFDVPGIWTTNDDPALADGVVTAAERTLAALPNDPTPERARLLTTLAMESRGTRSARGRESAAEAESMARRLGDPGLLAFALNGRFMHTFERAGLAAERGAIGRELVTLASTHALATFEVLGRLMLVQAHSALGEFTTADEHAAAADELAGRYDLPVVGVFTEWYAALRLAAAGRAADAETAYRTAAARLAGTGMWGIERGILPLALLSLRLPASEPPAVDLGADWGPHLDRVRPLGLLAAGDRSGALDAARSVPESPPDLLYEARTCLDAVTAIAVGDRTLMERAYERLRPAANELAGAGSGLLTFGPVARYLGDLAAALDRPEQAGVRSPA